MPSWAYSRGCEIARSEVLAIAVGTLRLAVVVSPECMRAVSKNTICSQARLQSIVELDALHTVRLVDDARKPPKAASNEEKPDSLAVCFLWAPAGRSLHEVLHHLSM